MIVCQEITEWTCGYHVRNNVYFLNKSRDKMFGYHPEGEFEPEWFPEPRGFEAKGRKFLVLEEREDPIEEPDVEQWKIPSSTKGNWTVKRVDGEFSCDCPAAKYRRQVCKHIEQIKKMLTSPTKCSRMTLPITQGATKCRN